MIPDLENILLGSKAYVFLSSLNRTSRLLVYVSLWAVTAAVAENMLWIGCC